LEAHQEAWQRDSLQKELAATRDELQAMRALLDELPGIFESRFASRMEPLQAQKQRLLGETEQLRQQLLSLQPSGGTTGLPALMPGTQPGQSVPEPPFPADASRAA
jgi:non-ribosomal peptide synthetase component E (peptide arylation enzyme)